MATSDPKATTTTTANTKRTRSQTTLDAFFSFNLAASPLKEARRNVAAHERPPHESDPPTPPTLPSLDVPSAADNNTVHDAMHDQQLKRPPSPAKDAALLHERDPKRPRHAVFPPPKPSSLPPEPSTSAAPPARAKSVPPLSSVTIPLLDLNNVPPSPRRSPTKFRIASVPRELPPKSPSPNPLARVDIHPPLTLQLPPKSPTFTFDQTTPTTHIPDDGMTPMSPLTPLPPTGDNTMLDATFDADATPVPRSPQRSLLFPQLNAPAPPPPALDPAPPTSVAPVVASQPKPASRQGSSFIPRASGVKARMRPKGKPGASSSTSTAAAESAAPSRKVKNPRDRERKSSILGGLVTSVKPTPAQAYKRVQAQSSTPSYLLPTSSSVAKASPVKQPFVVPRPAPRSRSASRGPPVIPQQQQQKLEQLLETSEENSAAGPSETSGKQGILSETPEDRLEVPPEIPEDRLEVPPESPEDRMEMLPETTQDKSEGEAMRDEPTGPEPELLSPLTDVPSDADVDELPQGSQAAVDDDGHSPPNDPNAQADDGALQTDETEPEPDPEADSAPIPTTGPPPLALNSSLSTLTEALERLNAPPPSRPQTSLGFHHVSPSTRAKDDERASEDVIDANAGLTGSGGRGGKGGRGRGRGRGGKASTAERPRPSTAMSMHSLTTPGSKGKAVASAAPESTPGQKTLKQTTLMLPPPVPGSTRTTRLRAAALRAANAASSSSPAVSRTPAKDGGVLRQGVLTLGKPSSAGPSGSHPPAATGPNAGASSSTSSTSSHVAPTSTFLKPGSTLAKPVFALGALGVASGSSTRTTTTTTTMVSRLTAMRGRFGGTRVTQRVSKASSLPVVIGSPVKGGKARQAMDVDRTEDDLGAGERTLLVEEPEDDDEMSTKAKIGEWLKNASKDVLRDLGHMSDEEDGDGPANTSTSFDLNGTAQLDVAGPSNGNADADADSEKAKTREREARRNASRRASMASHLLSQSLSALPNTVTPDKVKDVKGKGRAVSSSYPSAAASTPTAGDKANGAGPDADGEGSASKSAVPPVPRAHATRSATGALSTPPNAYKETGLRSSASQEGSVKGKSKAGAEESPVRLAVLKDCRIFVDVRTDEGDDAGGLFVEMLEGLGAKMANRVGSRCTHVVFKNGLMSTLSRYKLLGDPKPHVVGIAWVVECAEQCKKVDEGPFHVNLDMVNVAGVNKRRKSYLPKHVSPVKKATNGSPTSPDSAGAGEGTMLSMGIGLGGVPPGRSADKDKSLDTSSPLAASGDGDNSMHLAGAGTGTPGEDELESLPPLERARRRKSMLPSR